ncbi:sugar phosphate isomerase/epimerase family protein [Paludisphaera rhizosphaerae]|uniref:sugar phosphate isomerase/epimerase family protein n=1 Tax=Paludisphaera rhizosphaerae TaxID=2711216 RepID=UPI0013EB1402|nr:sugar phosphate isomerase/epimerase family protein [Paludisphaera rhizosphaerae]
MLQLGIVTYNIAKDWDLPTILQKLEKLGYGGVELRTTHKHGVEVGLSAEGRREVRKRFEDSPVELVGLGSAFEYHSPDPAVLRKMIADTKEYVRLAHDVGALGVKVRPNGIPKGEDPETAFKRIGAALHEVGEDAEGQGVEIRVEVHGTGTSEWPGFARIMELANHPNVGVCWNSNPQDVPKGGSSIAGNYKLVAGKIRTVHLRDLTDEAYPWPELFRLLTADGFHGFTMAEIPESTDPDRVLRYFRSLWKAYQPVHA